MDNLIRIGKIEAAISNQFVLEQTIRAACKQIQTQLSELEDGNKFHEDNTFVAVQLLNIDRQIIETVGGVFGENIKKQWNGISRHFLDGAHEDTRDIQADIVAPIIHKKETIPKTLVISGWHNKFDKWIYDEYKHKEFVRVWIPIILVRNEDGCIIKDWYRNWVQPKDKTNYLQTIPRDETLNRQGFQGELNIDISNLYKNKNIEIDVIGTVEIGYYQKLGAKTNLQDHQQHLFNLVSEELVIELAKMVSEEALKIYEHTLAYVFDTITEQAKEMVGGISSSLHFLENVSSQSKYVEYFIKSCSGSGSKEFLKECPIHREGLGQQAIAQGKTLVKKGVELSNSNSEVFSKEVRVMVASPLITPQIEKNTSLKYEGILYVHFDDEEKSDSKNLDWIEFFAKTAVNAIQSAINYVSMRDNKRILESIETVSRSLLHKSSTELLLNKIAGMARNILGADIVSIYRYDPAEDKFFQPITSGRLKGNKIPHPFTQPDADTGPRLLLDKEGVYFTSDSENSSIMNNSARKGSETFIERERINSSIGARIRIGVDNIGAIFIHYRHTKDKLSVNEDKLIAVILSWAAISISNKSYIAGLEKGLQQQKYFLLSGLYNRVSEKFSQALLVSDKFNANFVKNKVHESYVISIDIRKSTELMLKAIDTDVYINFILELEKRMREIVLENFGIIDKFTGDGILAYFPNFYAGEDAGLYCARAAHQCHRAFEKIFRDRIDGFQVAPKETGLGIGIDHGNISMHIGNRGEFIVVGAPVVYACRMSSVEAGKTAVNVQAQKMLRRKKQHESSIVFKDATIHIKNEGDCAAYYLELVDDTFDIKEPDLKKYGLEEVGSWSPTQGSKGGFINHI
ncbi:hypothetical protein ACFL2V_00340 [Pseudomonadota bacterium]